MSVSDDDCVQNMKINIILYAMALVSEYILPIPHSEQDEEFWELEKRDSPLTEVTVRNC